jgi:two-component system phosphate regulon response regulator OmpR
LSAKVLVAVETGFHIRTIADAKELELVLQSESFDLILFDGRELNESPLNFVESVRAHQASTPIVLLCAKPELDVIVKAIRFGVRDFFHPPVNHDDLFARIAELLQPRLSGRTEAITQHCRADITRFLSGEDIQSSGG